MHDSYRFHLTINYSKLLQLLTTPFLGGRTDVQTLFISFCHWNMSARRRRRYEVDARRSRELRNV